MTSEAQFTDEAIDVIAAAIFKFDEVWVAEAYSEFDTLPQQFRSAFELSQYIKEELEKPRGSAFFFVVYPDMEGQAVRKTIHLKPRSVSGLEIRYTWEGWGLISVILDTSEQIHRLSGISANSETRALNWQSTYPEWNTPSSWNWKAVERHTRRLKRVLKKFI